MKAVKNGDQGFRGKKGGMNKLSTEDYYGSETIFILFYSGKIYHSNSLKPIDYTIPGVNIIVNIYGLWMMMAHQCSFIDYNKCTTLCYVDSRRICVLWRYGVFVNQLPIFSAHFCFKSKSVLK